ncbi:putative Burgundy [Daphnia magna]|nr:putative Burgundy [Daphnia magna]
MTQYTTQQPLLVVFQCREFVVRASTQQGISRTLILLYFCLLVCVVLKREQQCIDYIRRTVGRDKIVIMLVCGGIDSAVCATLLHKALLHKALLQGDNSLRVQAIHIDNGFLRKDESEQVDTSLHQLGLNLRVIKASLTFYDASTNVHGRPTLSLYRTANDLNLTWDNLFLGQGTLRPDLIESASHRASSRADTIKNHHSDFEMVRQLRLHGRVVEPFKGHCIEMFPAFWHSSRELHLPAELLERHPFPGPDKERAFLNRIEIATSEEDRLLLEELSSRNEYVAKLLPIRTVGVHAEEIRNLDVLLAEFYKDCSLSSTYSERLCVIGDRRYTYLLNERKKKKLAQRPIVLIPLPFDSNSSQRIPSCQGSVIFRPYLSQDFMIRLPAISDAHLPQEVLDKMVEVVLTVPGIFRVFYDLTAKPPATTEREGYDLRMLLRQIISALFIGQDTDRSCIIDQI